jgi:rRNA maturation endonuclease Nob1
MAKKEAGKKAQKMILWNTTCWNCKKEIGHQRRWPFKKEKFVCPHCGEKNHLA